MREVVLAVAFAAAAMVPYAAAAEAARAPQSPSPAIAPASGGGLASLLRKLHIDLISPAKAAAESTEEGETCSADEECCAGLRCGGGPPATCSLDED
jgi:hypothetical protein